jgi:hypothetical protein
MTTSLTTFKEQLRERLLDVVYAQWRDLGVPFATAAAEPGEVIDPEALLWCSLEFFPNEPRLREAALAWLVHHEQRLITHRIKRHAREDEARTYFWRALTSRAALDVQATEGANGIPGVEDPARFCRQLAEEKSQARGRDNELGLPTRGASTVLLSARDLLGSGTRHFLLVYLLANPSGGKLKTLQRWSHYAYRSIQETASRWEAIGVVAIDRGYCYLTDPDPWHTLLPYRVDRAGVVDWFGVFDALVQLLRALDKAERKDFTLASPVVESHLRGADQILSKAVLSGTGKPTPTLKSLRQLLTQASPHTSEQM